MHKVVVDKVENDDNIEKRTFRSGGDRDYTIKLIQMLGSRVDNLARRELYKRYAGEQGMRNYLDVFEDARKRELAHIEWLKEQIRRSIR